MWMPTWMPTLATVPYGPARGCDQYLNTWCEANCPHAPAHSPLFARLDTNQHGGPSTWRCYAKSTLTDDLMHFKAGDTYCTRPQHLGLQMMACLNNRPPPLAEAAHLSAARQVTDSDWRCLKNATVIPLHCPSVLPNTTKWKHKSFHQADYSELCSCVCVGRKLTTRPTRPHGLA